MNALARSSDRTVLLILPNKGEAYPLSTAALTCAQASLKQLRDVYMFQVSGYLFHVLPRRAFPTGEDFSGFHAYAIKLRDTAAHAQFPAGRHL